MAHDRPRPGQRHWPGAGPCRSSPGRVACSNLPRPGRGESSRSWSSSSALDLVTLFLEKGAIDLLGVKTNIAVRHPAGLEVILPTVDHSRDRTHLANRIVLAKREHRRH